MEEDDPNQMEISILKWVKIKTKDGEPHPTVTAEEVASKYGCPREVLKVYLEHECAEADACWGLPFTLLLVISYAVVALSHDNAVNLRAVDESLDFDVLNNANFAWVGPYIGHKTFEDVNSVSDFWSWMQLGLVPLVFVQSRSFHEAYPDKNQGYIDADGPDAPKLPRGFWLYYNRIVGGIRMVQERSGEGRDKRRCDTLPELLPVYDMQCVFGLGYELDIEMRTARTTTDPQKEVWLYAFEDMPKLQKTIWDLERSRWLDRHTRKVEIAIPVYNGEVGVHAMIYVDLFFSRGGHIWKKVLPLSTYAQWHPTPWYWVGDCIWLLCVFYIFATELIEIYSVIKRGGAGAFKSDYLGFWNAFDWISMFSAFALIGMFIGAIAKIAEVNESLEQTPGPDSFGDNSTAYSIAVRAHANTLESTVKYLAQYRICMAAYPLIIILRLFKAYHAQPRLAIVTKTLSEAGMDLEHFGLVFCSVFVTFAISGVVLFGREVEDFGTLDRAFIACFRIMMGELMWDEISKVGRTMALIWLFLYMVVIVMLLVNMLLAIIMEHYVTVKEFAGAAQPLWEEAREVWVRTWQVYKKECVALDKVLLALVSEDRQEQLERDKMEAETDEDGDELPPEQEAQDPMGRLMFVDDLKRLYIDQIGLELPEDQAQDLLECAITKFYNQNHGDVDMDEVMNLTRRVDARSTKLNRLSREYDKKKSCDDEVGNMNDFVQALETYTDELRQERETQRRDIEELRALKHGLLLQLQIRQAEVDPKAASVGAVLSSGSPVRYDWTLGKRMANKRYSALKRSSQLQFGGGVGLVEIDDEDEFAGMPMMDPLDTIDPRAEAQLLEKARISGAGAVPPNPDWSQRDGPRPGTAGSAKVAPRDAGDEPIIDPEDDDDGDVD